MFTRSLDRFKPVLQSEVTTRSHGISYLLLSILSLVTGFLYGYSLVFYSFVWACIYFGAYMTGPEVKSEKKLTNSFFFF